MRLADAGLETVLIFDEGYDLPHFAAFPLVDSDDGRAALRRYYEPFLALGRDRGVPLVLSAPTWRANPDWGRLLGYEGDDLAAVNRRAVELVESVRDEMLEPAARGDVVIEASIGPRGRQSSRSPSASPSRPTAASPTAVRSRTRSSPWTRPRTRPPSSS